MPQTEYKIDYHAPADRIGRDIDAIIRHLQRLEAAIDKSQMKMKALGMDTSGLAKYLGALRSLDANFAKTVASANNAEKELKDVGKGNSSMTSYEKRLQALISALNATAAAGATAQANLTGVGTGGPRAAGAAGATGRAPGLRTAMAAGIAMQGLRKLGGVFGDSLGNRREYLAKAGDVAAGFRGDLQELAAFQGKPAADDALIREQLAFQQKTGMGPEEAAQFRLAYGSANVPGLKLGNISTDTSAKLEPMIARFGKRYGIDAETTGQLAGLISATRKIGSADEGIGILGESAELLNIYGRTTVKSMAGPLVGLQAEMLQSEEGGRFKDFESMAGVFGPATFKFRGPAQAATGVRQANRLIRSFGDTTPLGISKEKFLRDAGITPDDDFESGIRKLAAAGVGPTDDLKLKAAGFHNVTDIASTLKFIGLIPTIDAARADPRIMGAAAAASGLQRQYEASQAAKDQAAENAEFTVAVETGLAGERMRTARTMARSRLADPNQPGGQRLKAGLGGSILDYSTSFMTTFGGVSGEELRIDTEAMRGLIEGGRKVGVDVRKLAPYAAYRMDSSQNLDADQARLEFNRAWKAVESAGGDPLGGTPADAARALRRAADALDALPTGRAPGPALPPPPGTAGGGFVPGRP